MKKTRNFRNIVKLAAGALFAAGLFFNVSLVKGENGESTLTLTSLQSAQAQDGENPCPECPPGGSGCATHIFRVVDQRTGEVIYIEGTICFP